MSNVKNIHFAEFVLNALNVNFESIVNDDDVIDVRITDEKGILMNFSSDFKSISHFYVFDGKGKGCAYKAKNVSIGALLKDANKISSVLNKEETTFDMSACIKLTG